MKIINLTNGVSFGGKYTVTSDDVGVAEVVTLTITSGCTTDGTVTVLLPDGAIDDIAVTTSASTAAGVATLIAAGTYTGWSASADDAVVTFTATAIGAMTGTATLTVNSTGVVGTFEVTTTGTDAEIEFDFSTSYLNGTAVSYGLVPAITVLTSAGVFVPLTDAVITVSASTGVITLANGATFTLVAGYVIYIVAQRLVVATDSDD